MKINPVDLRKSFDDFKHTADGKQWMESVGFPGWLLLIASPIQAFCGWLMLFTVVLIPRGLRWIASGITFRPYRRSLRKQIKANLDTLEVIPACGIIIGPTGASLVLGSFSPIDLKLLASLARQFAELYSDGSDDTREAAMLKLLRDDVYQPNRRRRVPVHDADGHELFLFDTYLDVDECQRVAGGVMLGLAVTPGESGVHVQVPWKSVGPASQEADEGVAESRSISGSKSVTAVHPNSREVGRASFLEHLEQMGTVDPTPLQESIPGHPPLTIHIVTDENDDKYLVTEGMSSHAMTVPPGGEDYQYAELSVFLRDKWPIDAASLQDKQYRWPIDWLRKVARYPHQNQTWVGGQYAIIANGEPPAPLGPRTELTCLLVIANPNQFGKWIREDGQTVVFYDIIPLYTEERDFEMQHGIAALMSKFEAYAIAPWVNPNRVNTCLLSEGEEAAIDAKRERGNVESDTYALAPGALDADLPELIEDFDDEPWDDLRPGTKPKRVTSPKRKQATRRRSESLPERVDLGDVYGPWWLKPVRLAGNLLAIVGLGTLIGVLFPQTAFWLIVGYVLTAIVLLGRAWVLPFRHALEHDKFAATLFFLPWYFVKYSVRNWPQTRDCATAIGLFLTWIVAPFLIGLPIALVANLLPKVEALPAAPQVAGNVAIDWDKLPKPVGIPGARPQNPDLSPTKIRQETTSDDHMLLTITWGDGTVGTWKRPLLVPVGSDPRAIQKMREIHEQDQKIHAQINRAEVGAVVVADIVGSEAGLIYGGDDGIYSMSSSLSTAAVHAGLVKVYEKAKVKLTVVPKPDRLSMLTQNGLISVPQGLGFEKAAFKIELAKAGDVSADAPATDAEFGRRRTGSGFRQPDTDNATDPSAASLPRPDVNAIRRSHDLRNRLNSLRNQVGETIVLEVIGSDGNWVYGGKDGIYTVDSDPNIAAVHAGLVKVGETAKVKLTILPEQPGFTELKQNGITSHRWPGSYVGFRIELANDDDQ